MENISKPTPCPALKICSQFGHITNMCPDILGLEFPKMHFGPGSDEYKVLCSLEIEIRQTQRCLQSIVLLLSQITSGHKLG